MLSSFLSLPESARMRILAIDFNPEEIKNWRKKGQHALYGDACDLEFYHTLPLQKVKWVISAMPEHDFGLTHEDPRRVMLQGLKRCVYNGKSAVSATTEDDAKIFKDLGADIVFLPFRDAAEGAVNRILEQEETSPKTA